MMSGSKMALRFCLSVLLAAPVFGLAQSRLGGEIVGTVFEAEGETLPGVAVTLTGEKLFQKNLTTVSSEKGVFRFLDLSPGSYQLDFSLPGFSPLRLLKVEVRIGQTTPLRVTMTAAAISQEIEVVAQAPLIETKTAQVSTNYSVAMIEKIPTSRNLLDLTEAAPGINDRGAYGAGGIQDGNQRAAGTTYYQGSSTSAYLFDGVDISDLDTGATWVSPLYESIEEIQVVGIGASAEYGNFSGALLNVITKKGTNAFHGGASFYYTSRSLQGDNSGGIVDLRPNDLKFDLDSSAYLGGPIVKEKLFFFLAGGYSAARTRRYGEPAYGDLKQPHWQAKLNWIPSSKHALSFLVNTDPLDHENLGLKPGSGPEIGYGRQFRSTVLNGSWQYTPSSSTLLSLKYAGFIGRDDTVPVSPDTIAVTDRSANRAYGSSGFLINDERTRHQVNATVTHYADNFLATSHEFKFGVEVEFSSARNNTDATGPNGTNVQVVRYGPIFLAYGFEGYNIHSEAEVKRAAGFIQDSVAIGKKVALNLGLRLDSARLAAPSVSGAIAKFTNLAPRLGLTYDLKGDAKNVLRLSYGRYFDKTVTSGFLYALPGLNEINLYLTLLFKPFDPTPAGIESLTASLFQPQNLLFTIPASQRLPVASGIHSPYTDVFGAGFEKAIFKNFALSIDYVYRRDHDPIRIATRTQHSYSEVQYTDPYLQKTVTLWQQTDRLPNDYYYGNSGWAKRRHHLLMLSLRKMETGRWSFMSSFVFQDSLGNDDNTLGPVSLAWGQTTDPNFTQNPLMYGKLTYNRTFQFKVLASYFLPWGLAVSGDFRVLSGLNWQAEVPLLITGIYRESFYSVPLEERGSRQFPTTYFLNLRLLKSFSLGAGSRIELIADVLNLLNRGNAEGYYRDPSSRYPLSGESAFGKPSALSTPIQARLGVRWTF